MVSFGNLGKQFYPSMKNYGMRHNCTILDIKNTQQAATGWDLHCIFLQLGVLCICLLQDIMDLYHRSLPQQCPSVYWGITVHIHAWIKQLRIHFRQIHCFITTMLFLFRIWYNGVLILWHCIYNILCRKKNQTKYIESIEKLISTAFL